MAANTRPGARLSCRRSAGCSRSLAEASPQNAAAGSANNEVANTPAPGGPARQTRRVSWTATDQERAMPLPGDDLVPSPMVQATHAVTISAPPQQVWPWLVQTGQGAGRILLRLSVLGPVGGLVLPPPFPWPAREGSGRLSRRHRRADRRCLAESARRRHHRRRAARNGLLRRAAGRTRQVMGPVHRHTPAVPAARPAARQPPAGHSSASSATALC